MSNRPTGMGRTHHLRAEAVVGPETSEDPDIREVDLLQEFGKLPFGQERTGGGILSVYTVLRRHKEFNTGSLGSFSEGFLLVYDGNTKGADHDIDALERSKNAGLVSVVDIDELSTLGEPFRVGRLCCFLLSEILRSRQ